jgi:hypothetical protein
MKVQMVEGPDQFNIQLIPEDKDDILLLLRFARRMKNEAPKVSFADTEGEVLIEARKRHDPRWNANLIEAGRKRA